MSKLQHKVPMSHPHLYHEYAVCHARISQPSSKPRDIVNMLSYMCVVLPDPVGTSTIFGIKDIYIYLRQV